MKALQNNFTTPEQSKKLLELGLSVDSADCYYLPYGVENTYRHPCILFGSDTIKVLTDRFKVEILPCWSVGRLIEIFDICYHGEYHDSLILSMWMDIDAIIHALSDNECIDFSKLSE